jgi:hypothetical protein
LVANVDTQPATIVQNAVILLPREIQMNALVFEFAHLSAVAIDYRMCRFAEHFLFVIFAKIRN